MADQKQKPGALVMFPNLNKKPGETKPDYTGSFTTEDGEEYVMSVWENTSKKGNTYFAGSVKKKSDFEVNNRNRAQMNQLSAAERSKDSFKKSAPKPNSDDDDFPF